MLILSLTFGSKCSVYKNCTRQVPIPLRKKVQIKLEELEAHDIIVKENEPTY